MKAIIMAGGMGTRLRPVSGELPKPMVPLLGIPMMEHIVGLLRRCGFTDICAALKYRAGDIMAYFGDGSRFGVNMQYRIEETPLGTAGGVKNCADFYGSDDFLVISGDAACDFDLSRLMAEHINRGSAVTLALCRCEEPLSYGLAVTDGDGLIRGFVEKPDWPRVVTDCVNTGIYAISPEAMAYVPEGEQFDFAKELFPLLLKNRLPLRGVVMDGYWCDVGEPLSYYRCCADALSGRLKIELPENFRRATAETAAEAAPCEGETDCACKSRAALMGALSELFLELDADYTDGISVDGGRYRVHIAPLKASSAVRVRVEADDAELAKELCLTAKELINALDL